MLYRKLGAVTLFRVQNGRAKTFFNFEMGGVETFLTGKKSCDPVHVPVRFFLISAPLPWKIFLTSAPLSRIIVQTKTIHRI